jgi:hypothetical protein
MSGGMSLPTFVSGVRFIEGISYENSSLVLTGLADISQWNAAYITTKLRV